MGTEVCDVERVTSKSWKLSISEEIIN